MLATGDNEEQVARLARIAMLADGAAEQPGVLSNLLGAVAGAWALGVAPDLIRAGVKPYNPSAPLRADWVRFFLPNAAMAGRQSCQTGPS